MYRWKLNFLFPVAAFLLLFLMATGASGAGLEAEMVIYNGKILTADSPDPQNFRIAQAAAIYDGKFLVVDIPLQQPVHHGDRVGAPVAGGGEVGVVGVAEAGRLGHHQLASALFGDLGPGPGCGICHSIFSLVLGAGRGLLCWRARQAEGNKKDTCCP